MSSFKRFLEDRFAWCHRQYLQHGQWEAVKKFDIAMRRRCHFSPFEYSEDNTLQAIQTR